MPHKEVGCWRGKSKLARAVLELPRFKIKEYSDKE